MPILTDSTAFDKGLTLPSSATVIPAILKAILPSLCLLKKKLMKSLRISAFFSIALLMHHIYTQMSIVILKFLRFSAFISAVGLLSLFSARNFPDGQIRVPFHRSFDLYHTGLHIALRLLIWNFSASFHFFRKMSLVPLAFRRPLR